MLTHRRLIWLTMAGVAGVCILLYARSRSNEPRHAGHPLSYWLKRAYYSDQNIRAQAEEAIRSMGTNAVPTLSRWLSERDSEWTHKYNDKVQTLFGGDWDRAQPFVLGGRTWRAANALEIIGPDAKDAIPSLIANMTNHPGSSSSPSSYALALARIGPDAIQPLVSALSNPDKNVREYAVDVLGYFKANIISVLPELMNLIQSSDPELKTRLIRLIGYSRGDDRTIATLVSLLQDSSQDVREAAARSLVNMESDGTPALPKLIAMLRQADTNLQELLRFAITNINTNLVVSGTEVRQVTPATEPR